MGLWRSTLLFSPIPAPDMHADVMSKYLPRAPFFRGRDGLLNSNAFCTVSLK